MAVSDVDSLGLEQTSVLCESRGARPHAQTLDVRDRAAVHVYAEAVASHFGRVDVVINNAGITKFGTIEQSSYSDIENVLDVDFWGVVHGTKAFLPYLIASGDGHIVNVSSIFGLFGVPTQSSYNAAKFAVRGYTEALRQEMLIAGHQVGVTCVHPGGVKTAIVRNATASAGGDMAAISRLFTERLTPTSPQSAARTIIRGITRRRARVLVGADAIVVDMLVRILGSAYQRPFAILATRMLGALATTSAGKKSKAR
ncbi:estradiol 17-beta-dehydrogenase 11 [Mycolicibacterium phlei]|nr:estradiol 17-beta-dehydrogenase 11 [Mycolicibacterium phlei]